MLSSLSDSRCTFYHIAWWSTQSGLTTLLSSLIACWRVRPQNVNERNGHLFCSIKNSGEILNKLKSRGFLASSLSTYDFCTLYTTLPHKLIKEKLTELIELTFSREDSLYLACNDKNAFLLPNNLNDINCGHVRKCVMLSIIF